MIMSGGCLCGKLRYRIEGEPLFTAICHCRHCQKQSGSAFSVVVGVPPASLTITGISKVYADVGESGQPVGRRFCPECGSLVTTEIAAMPDFVAVKAGTLDEPASLKPGMHIWCDHALPWVQLDASLPQMPRNLG